MKKLLTFITMLFITFISYAQMQVTDTTNNDTCNDLTIGIYQTSNVSDLKLYLNRSHTLPLQKQLEGLPCITVYNKKAKHYHVICP